MSQYEEEKIRESVETAGRKLLEHLRECAHPKGKKGLAIRDLADRQLLELFFRLKFGTPSEQMARMLQRNWKFKPKMPLKSLAARIRTFRERAITPLLIHDNNLSPRDQETKHNATVLAKKISNKLDALATFRWAVSAQESRCKKWLNIEKRVPMKEIAKELKMLAEMCKDYLNLEMDLGLRERQPDETSVVHKSQFDLIVGGFENQGKTMLSIVNNVLKEAEEHVMTLEMGEDGVYDVRPVTDAERLQDLALGQGGGITSKNAKKLGHAKERNGDGGSDLARASDG